MDKGGDLIELTAQCLCKTHTFISTVPRSELPLKAIYCHCDSCRHATGAMYSSDVAWYGNVDEIRTSSLKRYEFGNLLNILFCSTCSSPMFWEEKESPETKQYYGAFIGALENVPVQGLVEITNHIHVGDTLDGGATPWLVFPNRDGSRPRMWKGKREKSEQLSVGWPGAAALPNAAARPSKGPVPVRCRCKGVSLLLDNYDPVYPETPRSELPRFVDPVTFKTRGTFDACDSCRLQSGADLFHWTFDLVSHISYGGTSPEHQAPFPKNSLELMDAVLAGAGRDPRLGTLGVYTSSPGIQRYFCSRCSACILYAADDRPEIVDIAIGVLESGDGARAESYLSWEFGRPIVWRGDVLGGWREDLVKRVEAEAENWRIQRGYPESWRQLEQEMEDA
ncbi:Mss4-like protein [Xylariomycetidae sp. FL2044]|nr:Mss4-like protein [Xylariomycetidae sp. FL2044]